VGNVVVNHILLDFMNDSNRVVATFVQIAETAEAL
jgi:hypothetical protein